MTLHHHSRKIAFAAKQHKIFRIKGHGLIQPVNSITNRLKQMTLDHIAINGMGVTASKHIQGGTIRYHDRPYQLKNSHEIKHHHHQQHHKFTPITFRL